MGKVFANIKATKFYKKFKHQKKNFKNFVKGITAKQNSKIKEQEGLFAKQFSKESSKIIVFLLPAIDGITGGILSIYKLYEETKTITNNEFEVVACRYPCDFSNLEFCKYTKFENDMYIYFFKLLSTHFKKIDSIILHIPEYSASFFVEEYNYKWSKKELLWWKTINHRHINILNQNILLMPDTTTVKELTKIADKVTQTTAHSKYANAEVREKYNIPLHHFSAFLGSNYKKTDFKNKRKLIMCSVDEVSLKDQIINKIKQTSPEFDIIIIKDMSYFEYREIARDAMFSITFGEGLDGYFIEPIWCGGVSFAVYNKEFFTDDFKKLQTVFDSYEDMLDNICEQLAILKDEKIYNNYNNILNNILDKQYSVAEYKENIKNFYEGKYLYP